MVVGLGVPLDNHTANPELLALHHANLNVDGVSQHALLNGTCLEGQIPIVLVK